MESNGKAFNDIRALLNKMDRSIDDARSKRLGPAVGSTNAAPKNNTNGTVNLDQEVGGYTPVRPLTDLQRKRAAFGRAKPLGRNDNQNQWKATGTDGTIG